MHSLQCQRAANCGILHAGDMMTQNVKEIDTVLAAVASANKRVKESLLNLALAYEALDHSHKQLNDAEAKLIELKKASPVELGECGTSATRRR